MFRIIDRRLRSASSKLENSAEMVLAKAQQQSAAVRSLSLRSRSKSSNRSREQKGTEEEEEEREGGGTSRTLLGLLSPRNWTTTATGEEGRGGAGSGTDPKVGEEQQPQEGREMNYVEVRNTDTLEGIAAAHDCTVGMLVKMNKLPSRMVYPGQKLLVPSSADTANGKIINNNNNDKLCKGPGHAVRATSTEVTQPSSDQHQFGPSTAFNFGPADEKAKDQNIAKDQTMPMARRSNAELGRMASELDPEDQECMQRFLKIRVKQVTESDGTIVGTLLVTPNCLMFDPDIDHPLVMENGSDLYGMIANMEDIVSVTVYKNIASLIGEKPNKEEDIFDPKNVTGTPKKSNGKKSKREESIELEEQGCRPRTASDARSIPKPNGHSRSVDDHDQVAGLDDGHPLVYGTSAGGLLLSSTLEERNAMLLSESSLSNSEQQLPSINEELEEAKHHQKMPTKPMDDGGRGITEKRRTVSDMHCQADDLVGSKDSGASSPSIHSDQLKWLKNGQQSNSLDLQPSVDSEERRRTHSDLEQSNSLELGKNRLKSGDPNQRRSPSPSAFSRYSPGIARRSFGKLGRTLSAKATSIKGTVQSGAQTVATGTQKVAHGVVTHTLSAADHIQTGIQTGAKVMASVPSSIVNVSTELLQEGQSGMKEVVDQLKTLGAEEIDQKSPQAMKREKSLATLESLRQQTHQKREQAAVQKALDTGFVLGAEESPALDECDNADASRPIGTPPDPPYYMIVRVDRRRKRKKQRPVFVCDSSTDNQQQLEGAVNGSNSGSSSASSAELVPQQQQEESCAFGNKRKREFWFAIPRNRVDAIYHFLLQWSPQKYGQEKASTADETNEFNNNNTTTTERVLDQQSAKGKQHLGGFVVLEGDVDDTLAGEKPSNHFGNLNREWEVVTVRELCRRLSLEDSLEPSEMPLPEGALQSQVLDEFMIRQIVDILPPRAEGYPWVQLYNSEKHGFSLATLYRKMCEWNEEVSPVLLVVRDVQGHVFGAVASTALKPSDHYYGTGDSCLLFRFTGEFPHTRELRAYTWTGDNQFFVNATREFLSFGAGAGHYGLWLDADLNHGRSQKCATFDNEPLAGGQDEDFVVQFVEVFGFSMS